MALPVNFDPNAAIRIYNAVRKVESGDRDQKPLTFRRVVESGRSSRAFRMATFTGSWSINGSKVVTFSNQTSTPNTASVKNELVNLPNAGSRKCAIAREGSAWYLVNWQWDVVNAATAATLTDTSLRFDAVPVGALSTATSSSFSVSVATCATSTAT
jgi:hypothetical protein